jgi:hypothetical protein
MQRREGRIEPYRARLIEAGIVDLLDRPGGSRQTIPGR